MVITTPYIVMDRLVDILITMYKAGHTERSLPDLAQMMDSTEGSLKNAISTINLLGLATVQKGVMRLTESGQLFCHALRTGKEDNAREVILTAVRSNEVLEFVRTMVQTRGNLSVEEVGRIVSQRYSKGWKNIGTMVSVGRACGSILAFAGVAYYDNGVVSIEPLTIHVKTSIPLPELGFEVILKVLDRLSRFERAKPSDLFNKQDEGYTRIPEYLVVCEALGLVKQDGIGTFMLTKIGAELADPTVSESGKKEIFGKALMDSSFAGGIKKLTKVDGGIDAQLAGKILGHWLKRKWSASTEKTYGKKFLNWLKHGNILERVSSGKYRISIPQHLQTSSPSSDSVYDTNSRIYDTIELDWYFMVGRLIGNLEAVGWTDSGPEFENILSKLSNLLREHEDIALLLESLATTYHIENSQGQGKVYSAQIDLAIKRIRERIGLSGDK